LQIDRWKSIIALPKEKTGWKAALPKVNWNVSCRNASLNEAPYESFDAFWKVEMNIVPRTTVMSHSERTALVIGISLHNSSSSRKKYQQTNVH